MLRRCDDMIHSHKLSTESENFTSAQIRHREEEDTDERAKSSEEMIASVQA